MRVKDVCEVNSKSLPADAKWDYYLYLDTSNITENMIDEIQKYEKKDDLP